MPRKARLIVPGAVYHVMSRCLDHYRLFSDNSDREFFLEILETCLNRTNTRCYAWVLMDNHYHLVLRLGDTDLWEIMKPLNMRYALYHRRKIGRRGPLFMDRFKSIITQDQNYVQELVRYVHLNPIRAGICRNLFALEKYRWSGHGVLLGRYFRKFQDTKAVLRRFGNSENNAHESYRQFIKEGAEEGTRHDPLVELVRKSNAGSESGRKPACWAIGDQEYVKEVTESAHARRLRISRFELEGGGFHPINKAICDSFGISADTIQRRHRGGVFSDARKAFAFIAAKEFKAPLRCIAEYLDVGCAAVSSMIYMGRIVATKRKITI